MGAVMVEGGRRMRADSWERWAGRLRKVDIG